MIVTFDPDKRCDACGKLDDCLRGTSGRYQCAACVARTAGLTSKTRTPARVAAQKLRVKRLNKRRAAK